MSSFFRRTKHPITGEFLDAWWIDNYFGQRKYGVIFGARLEEGKIVGGDVFEASKYKWETSKDEEKRREN